MILIASQYILRPINADSDINMLVYSESIAVCSSMEH